MLQLSAATDSHIYFDFNFFEAFLNLLITVLWRINVVINVVVFSELKNKKNFCCFDDCFVIVTSFILALYLIWLTTKAKKKLILISLSALFSLALITQHVSIP